MAGAFAEIMEAARKKAVKRRMAISSVKKPDMEIVFQGGERRAYRSRAGR